MIVTYDEHGGFFDHVSPPAVRTLPPTNARYERPFECLGVRVPAFVISLMVRPRSVCKERLDHTSILKFIGQRFGEQGCYSDVVDARAVASVADVLVPQAFNVPAPAIGSLTAYLEKAQAEAGYLPAAQPQTPVQHGFKEALEAVRSHPDKSAGEFADLLANFPAQDEAGRA